MLSLFRNTSPLVRIKFYKLRSISTSRIQLIDDDRKQLPSRKYYENLTENLYMQSQMSRSGRRAFEIMNENPVVVKKFFISDMKDEDFEYPDVLSKNDFEQLKEICAQKLDLLSKHIEYTENGFSMSVYEKFKEMKLFGYNVPKKYGGQGFTHTQCTYASEIEANNNFDAAIVLNNHRLVCTALSEIGTPEQCAEYLPKLANGEIIGITAFEEWNDVDQIGLNTQAEYDEDNEEWCLNGTKSFVVTAAHTNLFLVTADTEISDRQGDKKNSSTIFLIDSRLAGITIVREDKMIGHTNLYRASIKFADVIVPKDSILSIPGSGDYVRRRIQMKSRLNDGLFHLTQMKHILQYMMNMVETIEKETETENQNTEMHALRSTIGKYASSVYASESMLYLTAGIMDQYDNTNIDLETSIFKIYSQKQLFEMTRDLLNFVDTRVTLSEHPLNQLIRNAISMSFSEMNNELKMHIGTEGIQHRLKHMIEEVTIKKNKDFVIKTFTEEKNVDAYESELQNAAKKLFKTIVLLRLGSSNLLKIEARDLPKQHIEIQKIGDAAISIYASYASLLRADRSLKLKLPNALDEVLLAQTICDLNSVEVNRLMDYISDGPVRTFSKYHEYITQTMLEKDSNFPVHPLTSLF